MHVIKIYDGIQAHFVRKLMYINAQQIWISELNETRTRVCIIVFARAKIREQNAFCVFKRFCCCCFLLLIHEFCLFMLFIRIYGNIFPITMQTSKESATNTTATATTATATATTATKIAQNKNRISMCTTTRNDANVKNREPRISFIWQLLGTAVYCGSLLNSTLKNEIAAKTDRNQKFAMHWNVNKQTVAYSDEKSKH